MSGDELERHLSLSLDGEPERLRRAVEPGQDAPLYGGGGSTPGDLEPDQDARMEAPPDDMFDGLQAPPSRPTSVQVGRSNPLLVSGSCLRVAGRKWKCSLHVSRCMTGWCPERHLCEPSRRVEC